MTDTPVNAPSTLFASDAETLLLPSEVRELLARARSDEQAATAEAKRLFASSSDNVDAVIANNKARTERLQRLQEAGVCFDGEQFWTADSLRTAFGLASVIEETNTELQNDDELDETVKRARATEAKAAQMSKNLPAGQVHAPIRRCFAPILRERDNTPKSCTLLLKGIEDVQHGVQPIEEAMANSRYKLPVHAPFQRIARYIQRCLIPQPTGEPLEEWYHAEVAPVHEQLKARYAALDREMNAKTIYETLAAEAQEREKIHDVAMRLIGEVCGVEERMRDAFDSEHRATANECATALDFVQRQAERVTASSRAVVSELHALEKRGATAHEEELKRLRATQKDDEYRMSKCLQNQEKIARRIRECYKELEREQGLYEKTLDRHMTTQVNVARADAAYRQFTAACEERHTMLEEAHKVCVAVTAIIDDVSQQVTAALDHCRLHVSRMLNEEGYRKMRVAKFPMANAMEWYRSVGDMMRIRMHRHGEIKSRMSGSWQLEFLLSQEERAHAEAVADFEQQISRIQSTWAKLTQQLVALEVPVPVLSQYDKEERVVRMRDTFMHVEGVGKDKVIREVQRRLEAAQSKLDTVVLPPVPPPRSTRTFGRTTKRTSDADAPLPPARSPR